MQHQIDKHIKYATIKPAHHLVNHHHHHPPATMPHSTVRIIYPSIANVNKTGTIAPVHRIVRRKIVIQNNKPPVPNINSNGASSDKSSNSSLTSADAKDNKQLVPVHHHKRESAKQAGKRYKHNHEVFYYLQPGDVIEYSRHDEVWNENDRLWAIYAGNGHVIRFDKHTCQIISEPYWSLANAYYMSRNLDLDRNYYCLTPQQILSRAHYALQYNYILRGNYSSDKNFVMWCRYDINKSDIEFSTNLNKCPTEASKYLMITRFLDSVEKYGQLDVEKNVEKDRQ